MECMQKQNAAGRSGSSQKRFQSYGKTLSKLKLDTEGDLQDRPDYTLSSGEKRKKKMTENITEPMLVSLLKDTVSEKSFDDFFRIDGKIGEGAHSVVYRCIDLQKNDVYAAKVLKRNDEELLEGMRQTYQIMKILSHQYILETKIMFISPKKRGCQIVSKYYPYPDLKKFMNTQLSQNKTIDECIVADIVHKILMAIAYMHEKGICHRDIKPENILYDPQTQDIKIIDFEISKMQRYSHEKLELWTNTGTTKYRAPQSFEIGYSFEVDLWAVGVITYEMLTGHHPFFDPYESKTRQKILNEEINFQLLDISKLAQKFLSKLLIKKPQLRLTASQALSDPFLLKQVKASICTCTSPMNSSFDQGRTAESESGDDDSENRGSKFYDQNVLKNFLGEVTTDARTKTDLE